MTFVRHTLSTELAFEGRGLHSGISVHVRLLPAEKGIRFNHGATTIEAKPENVADTNRCTRLGEISTIEHLMAALAGCDVTDVDVLLSAPELPALDGSAKLYVEAILGTAPHEEIGEKELPDLFKRVFVHEGEAKLSISAGEGHWRYEFVTPDRWPEFMAYESANVAADFAQEVAPARTFGFESEVPALKARGLAKGLDLSKALLIGESGFANSALFPDEPARHKLLDAMGDLYLSGIPIRFLNVVAERSGHRMNVQAAAQLREAVEGSRSST